MSGNVSIDPNYWNRVADYLAGSGVIAYEQVGATYTDFGDMRAWYVFAYSQGPDMVAGFRPADLGIGGPVYIYNYFADRGAIVDPNDYYSEPLADGRAYWVIAPIGPSGMAVLGDRGQFVSLGKKRIAALDDDGAAHVTIAFASGETSRTIFGYAPSQPLAAATAGTAGPLFYDAANGRFTVEVTPGPDLSASVDLSRSTLQ